RRTPAARRPRPRPARPGRPARAALPSPSSPPPSSLAPWPCPPSRREPAAALRHRRAERVEVLAARVGQHRVRTDRAADLLALAGPDHVERLAELVVPLAKRQRLALVAVERRRRLHERHEGGAVTGSGAHPPLAGQLHRAPRGPRGLGERGVEAAAKAPVQLAGAEALQIVVPAEGPEPRGSLQGK